MQPEEVLHRHEVAHLLDRHVGDVRCGRRERVTRVEVLDHQRVLDLRRHPQQRRPSPAAWPGARAARWSPRPDGRGRADWVRVETGRRFSVTWRRPALSVFGEPVSSPLEPIVLDHARALPRQLRSVANRSPKRVIAYVSAYSQSSDVGPVNTHFYVLCDAPDSRRATTGRRSRGVSNGGGNRQPAWSDPQFDAWAEGRRGRRAGPADREGNGVRIKLSPGYSVTESGPTVEVNAPLAGAGDLPRFNVVDNDLEVTAAGVFAMALSFR